MNYLKTLLKDESGMGMVEIAIIIIIIIALALIFKEQIIGLINAIFVKVSGSIETL